MDYTDECLIALMKCMPPLDKSESDRLDEIDVVVKKKHFTVVKNGKGSRISF